MYISEILPWRFKRHDKLNMWHGAMEGAIPTVFFRPNVRVHMYEFDCSVCAFVQINGAVVVPV